MKRSQLLFDGLWRCLCPAFDSACLSKAAQRQARRRHATTTTTTTTPSALQVRRGLSTEAVAHIAHIAHKKQWQPIPPPRQVVAGDASEDGPAATGPWDQRLLLLARPNEATLAASSLADITRALMALRDPKRWKPNGQTIDQHQRIVLLVQHLISARGQPPSLFLYECLADAMADPQGSVDGLRRLLDDMAAQGMRPTAAFCKSALDVLMNHPDYFMRQEMLDIMQQHWFTIDASVRQSLVLGLLRDEQYELAYSRLGDMIDKGTRIDAWVYDIFILVFGKLGFLDEMLSLLYRRTSLGQGQGLGLGGSDATTKRMRDRDRDRDRDAAEEADADAMVVNSLLYYALDVCSRAYHYAGTSFAWSAAVRNSRLQPSDGMLESVLCTAAREGDTQLATEVLEMISSRGKTKVHHYEAVVEAFCEDGDVAAAVRTFWIMRESGIRIRRSRVLPLLRAMRRDGSLAAAAAAAEAEAAVRELARESPAPQDLVGVILEVLAEQHGSERAMALYGDVPLLCGGEPPSALMTQDMVVHGTEEGTRRALLAEYGARFTEARMDPKRSALTYGTLVRICAEVGEMDLAFRFVGKAMASTGQKTRGRAFFEWVTALVGRAAEGEDGRIWRVVDELVRSGDKGVKELVKKLLQQHRMARRAKEWRAKQEAA